MTAKLAHLRCWMERLAATGNPADAELAAALSALLAGENFEAAYGLAPGWRSHQKTRTRDELLVALAARHPALSKRALGRYVAAGLRKHDCGGSTGATTDGALFAELARATKARSERQFRRLGQNSS